MSGSKGFLDYIAIRPPRILVIELKSEKGTLSPEQQEWFTLWEQCQKTLLLTLLLDFKGNKAQLDLPRKPAVLLVPEVYLWKPSDFEKITEILREKREEELT